MKIAVLFSNYMYSYIKTFLDLCEQNGIEVDFFNFAHDKVPFEVKAKNRYVIYTKWKAKKFDTIEKIENEIKSLVNVNDYDCFFSDTMGLSFENACNYFHGNSIKYKIEHSSKGLLQLILKLSHFNLIKKEAQYYKNTKFCFVGSKEMKSDYALNCNIPPEKIKIIPPGKDNILKANIEKKQKEETFTIGSVTCGFNLKGGYTVLAAIKKLKKEYSPNQIKFKLINPKYDKQWYLKLYVKFLGIEKYIEFLPFQKNINNFYASLDCVICASNAEAFGRVVTEAMISELPVIIGSNVGASDIIENGKNGYIYEYGKNSAENLAQLIKKAYNERNTNQDLIKCAYETANAITWKNFSYKLFNIIAKSA